MEGRTVVDTGWIVSIAALLITAAVMMFLKSIGYRHHFPRETVPDIVCQHESAYRKIVLEYKLTRE